jgi:hypothetical protein
MLEDITAMLHQAKLPPSFWVHCLATQVKVWNCLPMSALPGKTPFEAWKGKKPDLSPFRVFGCTAYVFVQKDKRKKLESHMEKCIFIGYPSDYKGWDFYNLTTKWFFVSECAEFDERYFNGLKTNNLINHDLLHILGQPPTPLPAPSVFFFFLRINLFILGHGGSPVAMQIQVSTALSKGIEHNAAARARYEPRSKFHP